MRTEPPIVMMMIEVGRHRRATYRQELEERSTAAVARTASATAAGSGSPSDVNHTPNMPEHVELALREVDRTRRGEHDREPERYERVDRAVLEPGDYELASASTAR